LFNELATHRSNSNSCSSKGATSCVADPGTKTYPGPNGSDGVKTWYGRKLVQVSNEYICTNPCGDTEVIRGTREVGFFFEDGYELRPYNLPYTQRYNRHWGEFMWEPLSPQAFNPLNSDVPELINWGGQYR